MPWARWILPRRASPPESGWKWGQRLPASAPSPPRVLGSTLGNWSLPSPAPGRVTKPVMWAGSPAQALGEGVADPLAGNRASLALATLRAGTTHPQGQEGAVSTEGRQTDGQSVPQHHKCLSQLGAKVSDAAPGALAPQYLPAPSPHRPVPTCTGPSSQRLYLCVPLPLTQGGGRRPTWAGRPCAPSHATRPLLRELWPPAALSRHLLCPDKAHQLCLASPELPAGPCSSASGSGPSGGTGGRGQQGGGPRGDCQGAAARRGRGQGAAGMEAAAAKQS